jgi:hypothetical protein
MKSDKCRSQRELNQQCEPVEIKWGWVLPKIIFQLSVLVVYNYHISTASTCSLLLPLLALYVEHYGLGA